MVLQVRYGGIGVYGSTGIVRWCRFGMVVQIWYVGTRMVWLYRYGMVVHVWYCATGMAWWYKYGMVVQVWYDGTGLTVDIRCSTGKKTVDIWWYRGQLWTMNV